ncbi:MAG: T9SS type A sorting domain-containing protein [Ignavibacteriae bacterium]|nr:T9SS type A sorting domain-containing protein [Ignavibacteriota bacterium]
MMKNFLLAILVLVGATQSLASDKLVVGYYPSWNRSVYPHTAVQYQNLTHIAHAFIGPMVDGNLEVPSGFLYPELIQTAHANGVKVVVSLGGWGTYSDRFAPLAADTAARHRFVQNLKNFCVTNGYDGADIDWEYPKNATERTNMRLLISELRQAFNTTTPALLLAMAGPATNWSGQWFDFSAMMNDFNWIGIMTYDFYGAWTSKAGHNSALYGAYPPNDQGWVDYGVQYYNVTRGVPKSKLLIGIPFYGQQFNASALWGTSTGATQVVYYSIAPKLQQGWTRYWDAGSQVPYMISPTGNQLISYDDSQSVAAKCNYVNSTDVAGAIIWAIGQDGVGARQPLLETVGAGLLRPTSVAQHVGGAVPERFVLKQNYPNPFNGATHIRYGIPESGLVSLRVFDLLGREVHTLAEGEHAAGEFDATISSERLSSGVYIYRLTWQGRAISKTLTVLR